MGKLWLGIPQPSGVSRLGALVVLALGGWTIIAPGAGAADKFPGEVLPWKAPLAATNLIAKPDCDPKVPSRGIAYLSWTPAVSKGREQRIAITIFPEALEKGEFTFSEALSPTVTNFVWKQLRGQAIHYWRVLTLHKDGWVPSKTAEFEGPTCVSDPIKPPQKKTP